jgi:hypothetical protein
MRRYLDTSQEKITQFGRKLLAVLVPALALGACTTLSDQDRALLSSASANADAAKQQSA